MIKIKYLYKAANKAGQTVEGIIEASSEKGVVGLLRSKSLFLLSLTEVRPKSPLDITLGSPKIPKKVLMVFCTQFASILKAGVPLIQAIQIMDDQIEDKKLKLIMQTVHEELQRGKGLSEAFAEHEKSLPPIMIKMIEAGEVSGTLDLSLKRLATHFEKEVAISKKVKSAVRYPIIVGIATVLVVILMLLFVLPGFMGFFEQANTELPGVTRLLLTLSDIIRTKWVLLLAGGFLLFFLIRFYLNSNKGRLKWDSFKMRAPVVGKSVEKILAARFSRTMSTLTSTGISLTQALTMSSQVVANKLAENRISEAEEKIKEGKSLHQAVSEMDIFPPMTTHMTKIGEESGMLDEMLEKSAEYFEEEADTAITKLTSLLQPIMLVIVAIIIVIVILAILLPMFQMYSMIS